MMKHQLYLAILAFILLPYTSTSQDKFFTKKGNAKFDATTKSSPESIVGKHKTVVALLDTKTGTVQFSVLMKGFLFEKALMEEHFNENYVESDQYPKSEFKGTILDNSKINYSKDGTYPVRVKGSFSLHGVSKEIEVTGKVIIKGGTPELISTFSASLKDYKITVPSLVADKLATTVKIEVDCVLEPLKK